MLEVIVVAVRGAEAWGLGQYLVVWETLMDQMIVFVVFGGRMVCIPMGYS